MTVLSTSLTPLTPQASPSHSAMHNAHNAVYNGYFESSVLPFGVVNFNAVQDTPATNAGGIASITDNSALASGVGGRLVFRGKYTNAAYAEFGAIAGYKSNASSGDFAGGLAFYTRANASSSWGSPRMSIDDTGLVKVGAGTTNELDGLAAPGLMNILEGSVGSPITNNNSSTVFINRVSAMTTVNDGNAALWVHHSNTGATQPVAIQGYTESTGIGDACAFYARSFTTTGRAYGVFALSVVSSVASGTPGAIGFNPFLGNNTGVDSQYLGGVMTPYIAGLFIQAVDLTSTGKTNGVGVQISDTSNMDVGISYRPGSVYNWGYVDESSSKTSLRVGGSHQWGLDLSPGSYSKGPLRIDSTGVGDNGFILTNAGVDEPLLSFDSGDFMAYFRTANQYQWLIGGTPKFFFGTGLIGYVGLPAASPGAGTGQFWYDPADGNRVKYAP